MRPWTPEWAEEALAEIDPGRVRGTLAVGLRDGALLALLAAGITPAEICALQASAITMERDQLHITLRRRRALWKVTLPADLGARVLAWLTENRLWADPTPVFTGPQGGLQRPAVYQILYRYLRQSGRVKSLTSSQTIEKNYERDPHAAAVAERS